MKGEQKVRIRIQDDETPDCYYRNCPNCGPSPERFANPLIVGLVFTLIGLILFAFGLAFDVSDLKFMLGPVCFIIGSIIAIVTLVFICKAVQLAKLDPEVDFSGIHSVNRVCPSPSREAVISPSNVEMNGSSLLLHRELTVSKPEKSHSAEEKQGKSEEDNSAVTSSERTPRHHVRFITTSESPPSPRRTDSLQTEEVPSFPLIPEVHDSELLHHRPAFSLSGEYTPEMRASPTEVVAPASYTSVL